MQQHLRAGIADGAADHRIRPVHPAAPPARSAPAGLLTLRRPTGNAALVRYVQRARGGERHRHGVGCGHHGRGPAAHEVLRSAGQPLAGQPRTGSGRPIHLPPGPDRGAARPADATVPRLAERGRMPPS